MSTSSGNQVQEEIFIEPDDRWRLGALFFLLVLSTVWPSPVLCLNDRFMQWSLAIDAEAFLGREAVQWDVVFWWIAGLTGIGIAISDHEARTRGWRYFRSLATKPRLLFAVRAPLGANQGWILAGILFGVAMMMIVDPLIVDLLVSIDQSEWWGVTSLVNRFGGGITPGLVVLFIGIVGITRGRPAWIRMFGSIVAAGVVVGMVLHVLKLLAGRSRPELWYGAFDFHPGASGSFPSGHTLSMFLVAGAVSLRTRSRPTRLLVLGVAAIVALTRVLSFRHWPSDVVFAALLGLAAAWFFCRPVDFD